MNYTVSIEDKKTFVRWFLKNFELKKRECVWILNYLLGNDSIMENIHFVEDAHYCPRAIVMTAKDSDDAPFRFYKNNEMTLDPEKAFHDLRYNSSEKMYVQLNFQKTPPSQQYLSVLEENNYIPKDIPISKEISTYAEEIINESLVNFRRNKILEEIDIALDNKDKKKFMKLSNLLLELT